MKEMYEGFLQDVLWEIVKAKVTFPDNDKLHIAFTEEAGEVSKALLDAHRRPNHGFGPDDFDLDVYNECVQAAAMACRLAVEGDPDFEYTPPCEANSNNE